MQIALDSVSLATKGIPRLVDVSFEVPDGSFVSVLGASGAGKSTLLGVVSGLIPQDSGHVLFDGRPVDDVAAHRRDVAVVFQDARLFPNMNALDNVAFPLKVRGVGRVSRRERAAAMLAQVQLEGMGRRGVHELSGGQRQRVALARALVAGPRAVLLDEPFSGLDESLRDDMRRLVLDLHERLGTTMLMVTHDPMEALVMSDRVAYLSHGHLVQYGAPADVLLHPATPEVAESFGAARALEGQVVRGLCLRQTADPACCGGPGQRARGWLRVRWGSPPGAGRSGRAAAHGVGLRGRPRPSRPWGGEALAVPGKRPWRAGRRASCAGLRVLERRGPRRAPGLRGRERRPARRPGCPARNPPAALPLCPGGVQRQLRP